MTSPIFSRRLLRPALSGLLLAAFPLATVAVSTGAASTPLAMPPADTSTSPAATPVPPAISSLSAAAQATRLVTLKTRGDTEITRRLANLNDALTKIAATTTLTASDKSALTTQVQAEVTGLTGLKTKLDADTTLPDARTDVQNIVLEYRVYLLMLPKTRLVAAADRLDVVQTKLTALAAKLTTAIAAAKAAGQDVTAMQASLTDMQAKITAIGTADNGLVTKLLALQPSDYNVDHEVLVTYRTTLGTAAADAQAARTDAASIITALGAGKSPSPTASPAQ